MMITRHLMGEAERGHVVDYRLARLHHQIDDGLTTRGSLPQVIRVHSPAIFAGSADGFQASRPNAYQFA